ncbi:Pimeloyl-ACP methyl ester carboxylesterase [Microbacterium hydrothermale]|uniref:alpha/beta fold hydrolase n=1 Tax=Microbacterium hydrothermale TaxID=857427 RepID=UPI002227F5C0|nr:alpha/beta hydrolase [Microbacterium hydrothermale]MCW2164813.1 Pimeloyl-ACP methyl ester carboxylesterase [Microbacterium hydrothermale]
MTPADAMNSEPHAQDDAAPAPVVDRTLPSALGESNTSPARTGVHHAATAPDQDDSAPLTDRTHRVAVPEGTLHVGEWHPDAEGTPWLLVHGVTASHLAWSWVARETEARLIAPDLRGRGRSTAPGRRTGLAQHADDLVAVLDAAGVDRAIAIGHSMGAFITAVLADRHPDRVERVVLVDGGLPLDLPEGMDPRDAVRHVLGPTAARLDRRFGSTTAYRDFWRAHPAFVGREDPLLDAYFAYDLVGEEPELRPATLFSTVEADSIDQNTGAAIATALERMPRPTRLLAAERGLRGEVPPLYPDLAAIERAHPRLRSATRVAGADHYSIVMSPEGARAVVREVRRSDGR